MDMDMASKHEEIKRKVMIDWTREGRGRLYQMTSGLAVPVGSDHPIWYGPTPSKRFKGFSDLFGFEKIIALFLHGRAIYSLFCVIEIKTKSDKIKPDQKRFLDSMVDFGVLAYVAIEAENEKGYELKKWEEIR
jgi:hypothetical protein